MAQLSKINEIGILQVSALLNIILVDLVLFFEVGKTMGADQVKQTVGLILEDYKHLKPEDFKLCFNRFKKGHYGKLYDRLDGQIILDVLMRYDNERDSEIENIRSRENRELKKLAAQPLLPAGDVDDDVFRRNIEKLKSDLAASKRLREENKREESKPKPNPIQEMHMGWIERFNALYRLGPMGKGIKIINRYGRKLDLNAYLEHKQYQYELYLTRVKITHVTH